MKGFITTADCARGDGRGKVSALGAAWSSIRQGTIQKDLLVILKFSEEEAGEHTLRLALTKENDETTDVAKVEGSVAIKAPDQPAAGGCMVGTVPVQVPPIEVTEGSYRWALVVDGETLDDWWFTVTGDEPSL